MANVLSSVAIARCLDDLWCVSPTFDGLTSSIDHRYKAKYA